MRLWLRSLAQIGRLNVVSSGQLEVPPATLGSELALPDLEFGVVCSAFALGHEHNLVVDLVNSQQVVTKQLPAIAAGRLDLDTHNRHDARLCISKRVLKRGWIRASPVDTDKKAPVLFFVGAMFQRQR